MAILLFRRLQPLSTWLHGELGNHRIDGKTATHIAGTVHGWLIGGRAEIEAEMQEVVERSRQRGFPVQNYEDMQRLLGGHVAVENEGD